MKEKKKHYEAPEMKVHQVKPASIICTSTLNANSTEGYTDGGTIDGWN